MEYLRLYWDDVEKYCAILAREIKKRKVRFDVIVGIARGGLVPARILSDMLDSDEAYTVRVKFYESVGKTGKEPLILHPTQFDVTGKSILLVDDISDTGKSLAASVKHLKERKAGKIFSVTLVKKFHSQFTPDLFVKETGAWVVFPWEVCETVRNIAKEKKGEAARELKKAEIDVERYGDFLSEKL